MVVAKHFHIERISRDDLMALAVDGTAAPMQVGAVLTLDTPNLNASRLKAEIGRRVPAVPRLRQCLVRTGFGLGRPYWVDSPDFRLADHVTIRPCPAGETVLDVASMLLTTPLPSDRPLWAATIVTDVGEGTAALIIVFHHVLGDGIAGLAILAGLASDVGVVTELTEVTKATDDTQPPATTEARTSSSFFTSDSTSTFPRRRPTPTALLLDTARDHLRSIARLPMELVRFAQGVAQLAPSLFAGRVAASSLNRPTGRRRRFATVDCDLTEVIDAAHAAGATVNDVVLAAITGALRRLMWERGEPMDSFVISVPFSSRAVAASTTELGNHSGVIPLRLPATGAPSERVREVARITRSAKRSRRGASTAILSPLFLQLARLGFFQRFIDNQRLINTFATNMKGPATKLSIGGIPISGVVPLAVTSGNCTVSFAVLSYAGALTVTLIADPETCADLADLAAFLREELHLSLSAPAGY